MTRRADDVIRFSESHVRHMKDRWAGKPFILEPFQRAKIIEPIYGRVDRKGRRKTKRALIGLPRWHGKTETVAMLHAYHLFAEPVFGGEQYAFAKTRQQAALTFDTVKRMIGADPLLTAASKVYRNVIEVPETGCTFRCLPFDADTSQGMHPSFATGDEVHVMPNMDMVDAMVTGMVGREEPLFIAITTAAAAGKGHALDQLIELWKSDPAGYVYWQGAPRTADATDPAVWRAANPAPWITDQMLADQFAAMPLAVFERYHLNRKPTRDADGRVFTSTMWDACKAKPVYDPDLPSVLAVDAASKRDRTAVVVDQVDAEGVHNLWCEVWAKPEDRDYTDFLAIEDEIRHMSQDYNVARLGFDPAKMRRTMTQLDEEGYPVEEFPQNNVRLCPACQTLYELVAQGKVRHGGDPLLREHVLNAVVYERPPYGWRMTKPSAEDHIDAAIAAAMAVHMAEAEASAAPSFASTGGVWTL